MRVPFLLALLLAALPAAAQTGAARAGAARAGDSAPARAALPDTVAALDSVAGALLRETVLSGSAGRALDATAVWRSRTRRTRCPRTPSRAWRSRSTAATSSPSTAAWAR